MVTVRVMVGHGCSSRNLQRILVLSFYVPDWFGRREFFLERISSGWSTAK